MDEDKRPEAKSGDVTIGSGSIEGSQIVTGGTFTSQGDIVIGQKTVHGSDPTARALAEWLAHMNAQIEIHVGLSPEEKNDLKEQVSKIESEAAKDKQADPGRLEKLINTLAVMAPDIFEVAVATLANPLAGIGLVANKIGDRAKLERQTSA